MKDYSVNIIIYISILTLLSANIQYILSDVLKIYNRASIIFFQGKKWLFKNFHLKTIGKNKIDDKNEKYAVFT